MRPEPDRDPVTANDRFVLDLIGVDRLRADDTGLPRTLLCPHLMRSRNERSVFEAGKHGEKAFASTIAIRATRDAPPWVEKTAIERDQRAGLTEEGVRLRGGFP